MAPPPKYLIERALLRRLSRKMLPIKPVLPSGYMSDLTNCWKEHGIGSKLCHEQELKYDYAQSQMFKFRERLLSLGIRQALMSEMKRPVYPKETRGKDFGYRMKFEDAIRENEKFK